MAKKTIKFKKFSTADKDALLFLLPLARQKHASSLLRGPFEDQETCTFNGKQVDLLNIGSKEFTEINEHYIKQIKSINELLKLHVIGPDNYDQTDADTDYHARVENEDDVKNAQHDRWLNELKKKELGIANS